jgi:hypothetical protein
MWLAGVDPIGARAAVMEHHLVHQHHRDSSPAEAQPEVADKAVRHGGRPSIAQRAAQHRGSAL